MNPLVTALKSVYIEVLNIGRLLAATKPIEQLVFKTFEIPNGFFPPGSPSIEVRGFAPHLN